MSASSLVVVVPHTHWDREWYETAARFGQRLVGVLDDALALLERDAEYRCFLLDGQTVLLEDFLAVRPDERPRVEALVRGGRLLVGPWYVLADELLSSGEALVRNLLAGRRCTERLGNWLALGYSPDAFGHPAALPTILAGFGVRYAIVWRGYGGEPGQNRDLFRWVGPDGSPVLTHHLAAPGYEISASLPDSIDRLMERWMELESLLAPRAVAPVLLLMSGADHHAPDPGLARRVGQLNQRLRRLRFRIGSPLDYFAALPPALSAPEVRGELRCYGHTWTLQGVHSARAAIKRTVAEGDRLLVRWAEPQAILAAAGETDRRALLRAAWRDHLLNHAHDSLAGCVSDAVASDIAGRGARVLSQARGILVDALHDRLGQDRARARRSPERWKPTLVVINPRPWPAAPVVEATVTVFLDHVTVGRPGPAPRAGVAAGAPRVVAADGKPVPLQVLATYDGYERLDSPTDYPDQDLVRAFRVALLPGEIPALGLKALAVSVGGDGAAARPRQAVQAARDRLEGPQGSVSGSEPDGFSWSDRERGATYPGLATIESERDEGDIYTFQPVAGDRPLRARMSRPRVVWSGPLIAAIARDFRLADRARGTVHARLDAGSSLVRFVVEGVNLGGNHRLRVRFPLPEGGSPERSVADGRYGWVSREHREYNREEYSKEWPATTAPMHRYVSVAAGTGAGLTVFARGSFEYELTGDGALAVTVLRAIGDLSRGHLAARPGHAAWPVSTPAAQERGGFRLELAVSGLAVSEDSAPEAWDAIERLAEDFHGPCAGLMLRYGIDVPRTVDGPRLVGRGLAFRALKPAELGPGVVARCVNLTRSVVEGAWVWPRPVSRAFEARLDETPICELPLEARGRRVRFRAAPLAPVTIVVEP